jgi:mannosyltransferase OCH1-like enzyme
MIFSYWHSSQRDIISEGVQAWRDHFPDFEVIGDLDVQPVIARRFPAFLEVYQTIRIPACKSDIARLVALYEWGGLYVDCHCGVRDAKLIRQLLGFLDTLELIAVDGNPKPRQYPARLNVSNGIMFARRNSEILFEWAKAAFRNLANQRKNEKEHGFYSYCIWNLTGAGPLHHIVMDVERRSLKARFAQSVKIIPEHLSPIAMYVHCSYRQPGTHWHEREVRELLFD